MDGASIYILRCADVSYHTGVTRRSVDERVSEHALGLDENCYTFRRRPVTLVHAEHYSRIVDRSPLSVESKDGREQRRKLTFAAIMPRSLRLQNGAESARCGMADSGFVPSRPLRGASGRGSCVRERPRPEESRRRVSKDDTAPVKLRA